jgi:2-polyprenyl-3-methyl-5-hydroxy-6-metoxy-1,4-benzoquinol methylase
MSSTANLKTDWDAYYQKPAATAHITRRITRNRLTSLMREVFKGKSPISVCELGGGNSCFAEGVLESFPIDRYHIIDNNSRSLNLLESKFGRAGKVSWECSDVLRLATRERPFDLVYSVGLIEHFDPLDAEKAILAHVQLAKPGGAIILTFPTPTILYRITRRLIEVLGKWDFPDERPLGFVEVERALKFAQARILTRRVNWAVILTQGVIAARVG